VAVVHPDAVAIIAGPAFHDVVGEIRFGDLVVGINDNLGGIKSEEAANSLFLASLHPQAGGLRPHVPLPVWC
jgi:hypothetical protein